MLFFLSFSSPGVLQIKWRGRSERPPAASSESTDAVDTAPKLAESNPKSATPPASTTLDQAKDRGQDTPAGRTRRLTPSGAPRVPARQQRQPHATDGLCEKLSASKVRFLADAWKAAHKKARTLGWRSDSESSLPLTPGSASVWVVTLAPGRRIAVRAAYRLSACHSRASHPGSARCGCPSSLPSWRIRSARPYPAGSRHRAITMGQPNWRLATSQQPTRQG